MSAQNDVNESIVNRFNTLILSLEAKSEQMTNARLFGVWNHLMPLIFGDFVAAVKSDVNQKVLKLLLETKFEVLVTINDKLEEILSYADNIIHSPSRNSTIHEFVSYILRDLGLETQIPYMICDGESLATLPLIRDWKKFFQNQVLFPEINKFLEKFKERINLSIIFIPPVIIQNKEYWSLIVHELGHIIIEHFELVETYNPEVSQNEVDTAQGQNFFHGREYVSDFIANAYFGPVFYESLHEYLRRVKIYLGGTHPTWDARLFFLQEQLSTINVDKKIVKNNPSQFYKSIAHIDEIIQLTKDKVFDSNQKYYSSNDTEKQRVVKCLKEIIPFIGEPRILFNSHCEKKDEISESAKKKIKKDNVNPEQVISMIMEDSIHLSNMKRTFHLMVKSHDLKESLKT